MAKVLTKSPSNRIIFGVCGGVADYFGWDPTVVRLTYVVVSTISAAVPGILLYIAAAIIMPEPAR